MYTVKYTLNSGDSVTQTFEQMKTSLNSLELSNNDDESKLIFTSNPNNSLLEISAEYLQENKGSMSGKSLMKEACTEVVIAETRFTRTNTLAAIEAACEASQKRSNVLMKMNKLDEVQMVESSDGVTLMKGSKPIVKFEPNELHLISKCASECKGMTDLEVVRWLQQRREEKPSLIDIVKANSKQALNSRTAPSKRSQILKKLQQLNDK